MLIDVHVHAFNEKIAAKALDALAGYSGLTPLTDGTVGDTFAKLDEWGVDKAAILSIATKPTQQRIINGWAETIKSDRLLPFGSIHPDAPDCLEELERIKAAGLYGIKLHPDYQGFRIDEERLFPIYEQCARLSLPVILHSGFDYYSPDEIHCTPERALRVIGRVKGLKLILAHLGANRMWQQVFDTIAGADGEVYFDTSFTEECPDELMEKIILKHGADRVLFASDCPWARSCDIAEKIERLALTDDMKEKIFHLNAERLLGL
ncbi:amidohydrolase family protein [Ruminococcus sp. NK3A76]|uniref:amidohydrolase family protein n=1 Tax=Ruminococcus sp. NK3A76 TaxID=877411 RepID=UPI000491DC18|nr:amidohydrolase family protein [Ruminococcus sp. NK3A76]